MQKKDNKNWKQKLTKKKINKLKAKIKQNK